MTINLEALSEELRDLIEAERFEGPHDLEGRVVRRLDDALRRAIQRGQLGRIRDARVHIPEPGVVEVLLGPEPKLVHKVVLHLSPVG